VLVKQIELNEPVMVPHTGARKQSRCTADQAFGDFLCSITTSALVLAHTSICILLLFEFHNPPFDRLTTSTDQAGLAPALDDLDGVKTVHLGREILQIR